VPALRHSRLVLLAREPHELADDRLTIARLLAVVLQRRALVHDRFTIAIESP